MVYNVITKAGTNLGMNCSVIEEGGAGLYFMLEIKTYGWGGERDAWNMSLELLSCMQIYFFQIFGKIIFLYKKITIYIESNLIIFPDT